jgi:uridine kinase
MPPAASAQRTALIAAVAGRIADRGPGRLRVAVDGLTGAGKTSFGHELAAALRALGRPTMRASLDDFKHPWRHAREHGYDRVSGEGYYRNAYDFSAARDLLLRPAGPAGTGRVALCAFDPLTGEDHRDITVSAPPAAVLIVDSVFAFRPEYDDCWEYRIWLDADPGTALRRGIARDRAAEGEAEAARVHRDRYHVAEAIYLAEVRPQARADMIIDNRDFARPAVIGPPGALPGAPPG